MTGRAARRPRLLLAGALTVGLGLGACGASAPPPGVDAGGGGGSGVDLTQPVRYDPTLPPPTHLSAYNLFAWDPATGATFNPTGDRVVPYELNTALFSDYAQKTRAVYVPPGAAGAFDPEHAFELPVGSIIVKNFAFAPDLRAPTQGLRIVETRLLVRRADGWLPLPYLWDEQQADAVFAPAGAVRAISFVDAAGAPRTSSYLVPQKNQCETCHARKLTPEAAPTLVPIGLKARHLNRVHDYGGATGAMNQLDRMTAAGVLAGAPDAATLPAAYDFRPIEAGGVAALPPGDLDAAARSYLDINCSHCHAPDAVQGITSQLFLDHATTDTFHLGYCKRPGSAGAGTGGHEFDIVPGDPDASILYFRVHTEQVGAMMPLLGRSLTHDRGAELLRAWIAAMPAQGCAGR